MAFTGIMMTYERQLTVLADGFHIEPSENSQTLGIEELLTPHREKPPSSITIQRDTSLPVALRYGREKTEFIHPYTGKSLGEGNTTVRSFFRTMLTWHRWLGREGATRETGKTIIHIGNLMFLFILVSGVYLWIPRKWSLKGLRSITLLKKRLKGRARNWNWHNVFGFWAAIPLIIITSTGALMSYPWAENLIYKIAGESPPNKDRRKPKGSREQHNSPLRTEGLDAALTSIKLANPTWQSIQLRLPLRKTATFTLSGSHRGRPDKRREVTVALPSGEILKTEGFETLSPARKARSFVRWIHTGEAGGLPGQTIAGLAATSSIVLVWTGFSLSWRRFTKRRKTTA